MTPKIDIAFKILIVIIFGAGLVLMGFIQSTLTSIKETTKIREVHLHYNVPASGPVVIIDKKGWAENVEYE